MATRQVTFDCLNIRFHVMTQLESRSTARRELVLTSPFLCRLPKVLDAFADAVVRVLCFGDCQTLDVLTVLVCLCVCQQLCHQSGVANLDSFVVLHVRFWFGTQCRINLYTLRMVQT